MRLNILFFTLFMVTFLAFETPCLWAQSGRTMDKILLHDGSSIKGQILEKDSVLLIELLDGQTIELPERLVKKIESNVAHRLYFSNGAIIRTRGFYHIGQMSFGTSGRIAGSDGGNSFSLELINGFQFNPKLMLGMGMGLSVHSYAFDLIDNSIILYSFDQYPILPFFLELRGIPWNRKIAGYYSLQGGYGLGSDLFNYWNDFEGSIEGGLHAGASLGLRIASRKRSSFLVNIQYKMQKASGSRSDLSGYFRITNITFHRILLGIGWQF